MLTSDYTDSLQKKDQILLPQLGAVLVRVLYQNSTQ